MLRKAEVDIRTSDKVKIFSAFCQIYLTKRSRLSKSFIYSPFHIPTLNRQEITPIWLAILLYELNGNKIARFILLQFTLRIAYLFENTIKKSPYRSGA